MSEASGTPNGELFPYDDKVGHFVLFGVLGAALGWGRRMAGPPAPHWALLAVGWLYGALDEWHQSFVPGRTPDPADFLVDLLGVTAGYVLFYLLARRLLPASGTPGHTGANTGHTDTNTGHTDTSTGHADTSTDAEHRSRGR